MANPLTRRQANVGTAPPDRDPFEPVPEEYEGLNFPYRGIETHGVAPTVDPNGVPEWRDDARPVPVRIEVPDDRDPLPVRIVTQAAREDRRWRVGVTYVGTTPRQIVDRLANRTKLTIHNDSDSVVYFGPDSTIAPYSGYPVSPGGTLELASTWEVWAISEMDDRRLTFLVEYTVEG